MDVEHERDLELDATGSDISGRLSRWADKCGFDCIRDTSQGWAYQRGSKVAAVYTFDIRKIPTDVEVSVVSEEPFKINCKWRVHSGLTISTHGDTERIAEQFDLLIAYLKGAL